jgi:hypothetical protein
MSKQATKAKVLSAWRFADASNTAPFTSTHIFKQGLPILQVSHDEEDGSWQCHSGKTCTTRDLQIVGLDEVVRLDASMAELADLPLGGQAQRQSIKEPWLHELQPPAPASDD